MQTNKFESLRTISKKLSVSVTYLRSFIKLHEDLSEAYKPYQHKENSKKNTRLLPPNVCNLIYKKANID